MTKTEKIILRSLENKGIFYGVGNRACTAANKLIKKGVVERNNVRIISTYYPPVRVNCMGRTIKEITIYNANK